MKLRISLLTILIGMLFACCGLSTGKVAEQKEEGGKKEQRPDAKEEGKNKYQNH